jgi:ComF family protein
MRLPVLPQTGCCRLCAQPVEGWVTEFVCDQCRARRPAFDAAAAAFRFEGVLRSLLLDFKFNCAFHLRDDFADWLEASVRVRYDPAAIDAVVPVPLTLFRRWDRGYNQCSLLARALAARLDRPVAETAAVRCGHPRRQSDLPAEERWANVEGTFRVRRRELVRGRTILLVDDVMTTGATLSACAQALKEAGAERVWCATLARSAQA